MRLDKFLQAARLVKKREHTKELCRAGRLFVDGHAAKPARTIKAGEVITLSLWRRRLVVEVLRLPSGNVSRAEAPSCYKILEDSVREEMPTPD